MPGTSVYSILFYGGAIIVLVIGVSYLISVWQDFAKGVESAENENKPAPTWVTPVVKTIVVVVALIVTFNVGWNIKQSITTHSSSYKNPAEVKEKKEVSESKLPSDKELDEVRSEQKQRSEVKPHEDALKSFDESMKQEAEKIRKRSLDQ